MTLTLLPGYPDKIGKRFAWCGSGVGPSSYNSTNGDAISLPGFQNQIDSIAPAVTVSKTYLVIGVPATVGKRPTWVLRWYTRSSAVEVVNGTDLSAEKVQLFGFGGTY